MRSEFETLEQYQDSMKKFNENTRTGFENFIQSHGSDRSKLQLRCTPYTDKKGGYGSFDLDFGLSLWQHQQSKVDELQKRVDASLIAFEKLKDEINELHGQCDLHLIKYLEEKSQVLEQVIKGGSDASN